ncbi:adenylyl-sulfate kinase [Caballeronia sp. LZ065]|uniref:adenylyl-sulfate kinase n=1 Tax=Caballeronia sp. LZ065 TaxID=3038571 RepID=UPI00285BF8A9|nr:adenylyl-sulfate kinase [Caballeronia sp. LZ065]MDR5780162.1 adenylyl-sulfate kinase [Caballeronia sp. LZ065]
MTRSTNSTNYALCSTPSITTSPGCVFWLTGLSGAGKSTLAYGASRTLAERGFRTIVLDGDVLRSGLNCDLGFSAEARDESVRRAAEVAALCASASIVVFVSLVSPFEAGRARARAIIGERFHEIYVEANYETCQQRDVKGFYKLAEAGQIKDFTGLTSPYEIPHGPDLVVNTMACDARHCVDQLSAYALRHSDEYQNDK